MARVHGQGAAAGLLLSSGMDLPWFSGVQVSRSLSMGSDVLRYFIRLVYYCTSNRDECRIRLVRGPVSGSRVGLTK